MITIKNNKIKMTRGDTLRAEVAITTPAGEPYEPQEGDSVRFALKHSTMNPSYTEYTDTEPLLVVTIPIDTLALQIDPEDTKELGFGDYVYDIELTHADGAVDTFIATGSFTLTPEVH